MSCGAQSRIRGLVTSFEASHQSRHFLTACHTTEEMKVLALKVTALLRFVGN